jgi:hypothetical protein
MCTGYELKKAYILMHPNLDAQLPVDFRHDDRFEKSIQEALDSATSKLKHWTTTLPFIICEFDINCHLVESQCNNILQYLDPMYKGKKFYFADKYNKNSASGGDGPNSSN